MLTDPIADMLTRIRNANKALHEQATMPTSKMKVEIARLLKEEGYIRDYHVEKGESFDTLVVDLKFGRNRERVIVRPEARVQARTAGLRAEGPSAARSPLGVAILSTSTGLITARTAQERGIGGEVAVLHLVIRHESNRKKTHRSSLRRQRDDRAGARQRVRAARLVAAGGSAAHADRAGGRARSSSRGRPSAARIVRCTA